ncbi:ferrous iron transporter B [Adhaeretor mobilis]|uniref:Ferrous iron transport protein B n=1 Tax=Adhaeretor mobilis TaxID=1930276 RepID=A0A517MVY2_9BACT|nr:ferrous iron transporter B [Adhaeretor mobilis]QDS99043.1 Ferrous iron transport protein B [Adhaeretor mobilis]
MSTADIYLPVIDADDMGPGNASRADDPLSAEVTKPVVALVGNPNSGKTSLFNRLTGLRAHTANFAGTTVEHRRGTVTFGEQAVELVDLPGLYNLDADTPDERVACEVIRGVDRSGKSQPAPDLLILVIDSTNLQRNLFLASQLIEVAKETGSPVVAALNMSDLAKRHGLQIDAEQLSTDLGCPVIPLSARTGAGLEQLSTAVVESLHAPVAPSVNTQCSCSGCHGCGFAQRYDWAEGVSQKVVKEGSDSLGRNTQRIDRFLTHRLIGLAGFAVVMFFTFWLIYSLAAYPMDWIESLMAGAGNQLSRWLPAGDMLSLLADGIIGGVGGVLVFLPQICLLFFMLALLEDSGYLSRAALVMDRLMKRVGLPGKAFVPMLSAHACAIPAIMATRVIEDRRDRLATILVLPLMTCSARVPVYAMLIALLFSNQPLLAAAVFTGAYALGIVAALAMAWVFKRTILPGNARPLLIELPDYKWPSLRNALLQTYDRSMVFVKNAGGAILVISIVMWALATYPKTTLEDLSPSARSEITVLQDNGDTEAAENLLAERQLEHSFAGRIGQGVQPLLAPLGFDWKMSVGVVSSFAAREVIVSTLSILYGLGDEGDEAALTGRLRASTDSQGEPSFTTPVCLSLLVFYVLAMQCLPTQVITKRETGSWGWASFQFGYMTALAYVAALITFQTASVIVG